MTNFNEIIAKTDLLNTAPTGSLRESIKYQFSGDTGVFVTKALTVSARPRLLDCTG